MKLSARLNKLRFQWEVRSILDSPPLERGVTPITALSMVHHRDVLPYLLALKSSGRYLSPARVVLVADPTLTRDDRAVLREHVPHIEIREAAEFQSGAVPKGGTWERLCAIAEYAAHSYVVQLDADTLAIGGLDAVQRAVQDEVSFTLGTEDVQSILSCAEFGENARRKMINPESHIQSASEVALSQFDPTGRFRYGRGCSGFAGFARGAIDRELVEEISSRMESILGEQWRKWGSEQVTSNLIVCSSPGGHLLPHPDYCAPTRMTDRTVFLHFIGLVRFRSDLYSRLARTVIRDIARPSLQQAA